MKETILDVLMFMFQSYIEDGNDSEIDRNFLHKNLSMAGFADKNIEKAFDWLERLPSDEESFLLNKPTQKSYRLYSENEILKLGTEGLAFMAFLGKFGVINGEIREHALDRIMALDSSKVDITQVKWVILMILFNTPGNEINYTWLQNLEPNYSTPIIH